MISSGSKTLKFPGTQRILCAEDTLARVRDEARELGVTRLADITGLDRIGIPTYSAIVPRSEDSISVYTGKGLRHADAKAGALMEAIERQASIKSRLPFVMGSFQELKQSHLILDPKTPTLALVPDSYDESRTCAWIMGRELMSDREILLPAMLAGYRWDEDHWPLFEYTTTNGLSSGNIREEAICQGLCELIERDAWTLADLGAHVLPWVRRRAANVPNAKNGPDDFDFLPSLDLEDDPLVGLFRSAGLEPMLHNITSDVGVPTVYAAVADEMLPGFPMVHGGLGTHPDTRVAVRRALTEVAQSRCVDIQGVREDLTSAATSRTRKNLHTRRIAAVNRNLWTLNRSSRPQKLADIRSTVNDDLQDDIDSILSCLRAVAIDQVIVVDFTPPGTPFAVVRVIVPALESWSVNQGPLGTRALNSWRKHA